MLLSLRIGFGTLPGTSDVTVEEALFQIENPAIQVGVASQEKQSAPTLWPEKLKFSLSDRIIASREYRRKKEYLESSSSLSNIEKKIKIAAIDRNYTMHKMDALHLASQAIYGDSPVRQRFNHFWANHFTVGQKDSTSWTIGHLFQNVIEEGMQGKFCDLAYRITKHPSMLVYLDNIYNIGENSRKARHAAGNVQIGLNDNLGRELMELHTVSPSAGYSEQDIHQVAKILSGWGNIYNHPKSSARNFHDAGISDYEESFFPDRAEPGDKIVMGKRYPQGKSALQTLVNDLSASKHTVKHLSFKLCNHFISDHPSVEDINYVINAWKDSDGHLPTVHRAVIERAAKSDAIKFQWPLTWLLSVLRMSGSSVIQGWDEVNKELKGRFYNFEYRVSTLYEEMGQNFWSVRQPNGYSSNSIDWISPEHLERRMRFASMVGLHGLPKHSVEELIKTINAGKNTTDLILSLKRPEDRFVALTCSPEFMGG